MWIRRSFLHSMSILLVSCILTASFTLLLSRPLPQTANAEFAQGGSGTPVIVKADSFLTSKLPQPTEGRLVRLQDGTRGLLLADGTQWIDVAGGSYNVRNFGAKGNGVSDDTKAIQAAIDAAQLLRAAAVVFFPPGSYLVSDTLRITAHRLSLIGSGRQTTQIRFTPRENGAVCIQIGQGKGSDIVQNFVSQLSVLSTDKTFQKTALRSIGTSELTLRDFNVYPWSGNGSIGLQIQGHNEGRVQNCTIVADLPISIETNPNSPYRNNGTSKEDLDHWSFTDLYVIAGKSWPCIRIGSGLGVQNLVFEGNQSWVAGRAGLEWIDKACAQVGYILTIRNVRWEQSQTVDGYFVNIQHNHGLQGLVIDNCRSGAGNQGNGIYLRKCNYSSIRNYVYGGTGTGLDLDDCDSVTLDALAFQPNNAISFGAKAKRISGSYTHGSALRVLERKGIQIVKANYRMTAGDNVILADASGGPLTVILPPVSNTNQKVMVSKLDATANPVTVACQGTDLFLNRSTRTTLFKQDSPLTLLAIGSRWIKSGF